MYWKLIVKRLLNERGDFGSLFGDPTKDNPFSALKLPEFQIDPTFTSSQKTLNDLGTGILQGNIPDYFKPIGEFNGSQFQQLVSNVTGQLNQSSQENAAISGVGRSGTGQAAAAGAISNTIPQLQFEDFSRALQGRGALLSTGVGVEQGVNTAAQNQESLLNNFNLNNFNLALKQAGLSNDFNQNAAQQQGQLFGNIAGIGAGALGGFLTGGPVGALLGGLGAASGNSGGIGALLSSLKPGGVAAGTPSASDISSPAGFAKGLFTNAF